MAKTLVRSGRGLLFLQKMPFKKSDELSENKQKFSNLPLHQEKKKGIIDLYRYMLSCLSGNGNFMQKGCCKMSKIGHNARKAFCVFLCAALCFTSYALFAPTRVDAIVYDGGADVQEADKYGTPVWNDSEIENTSNANCRWAQWRDRDGKWVQVYYPKHIYLDVSETLQSAGYSMKFTWNYGNSGGYNYRIVAGGAVWGDTDQFIYSGKPANFTAMTDHFSNYSVDASLASDINGVTNSERDIDFYSQNWNPPYANAETLIWVSMSAENHSAYVYLQGMPTGTGSFTYSTSGVRGNDVKCVWYQSKSGSSWSDDGQRTKPSAVSDYIDSYHQTNDYKEIFWDVTIYDKSQLDSAIKTAERVIADNQNYTALTDAAAWNSLVRAYNTAKSLLVTRETTQNELDSAKNALQTAMNNVVFKADLTELNTLLDQATATITHSDYTVTYTAASRTAFENAIIDVRNSLQRLQIREYPAATTPNAGAQALVQQERVDVLVEEARDAFDLLVMQQASFIAFDTFVATHPVNECATGTNVERFNAIVAELNAMKQQGCTIDQQPEIDAKVAELEQLYGAFEYQHAGYNAVVILEPTCTEKGLTQYTCSRCGDTYTLETDALGHDFSSEFTVDRAATCTDPGWESRHCSRCDATTDGREIGLAPHDYSVEVEGSRVDATCVAEGSVQMQCSVCGTQKAELTILPKDPNNHVHIGDWEVETPATCGAAGTEVRKCLDCDATIESREIPATGEHIVPDAWDEVVEPVCGEDGYRVKFCSVCHQQIVYEVIPATGEHDYQYVEGSRIEPTCASDGEETYRCTICGREETRVLPMTPDEHQTEEYIVQPTCGTDGERVIQCVICHKVFLREVIPATGEHHYEVIDETESTCATPGSRIYQCSVCQNTLTETFPLDPANHEGPQVLMNQKDATCGTDGYTGDLCCEACGYVYETGEVIPATGVHTYDDGTFIVICTPDRDGVCRYTCTGCGIYYDETVVWENHTHRGGESFATCTSRARCEACGEPYGDYNNDNHTAMVPVAALAATCETAGHGEGVYCEACRKYVVEPEVIPALGHVDENDDQICDRCGAEIPEEITKENFRCSMCDTYEANKDKPLVGWIYTVLHAIVHFFESMFIPY